MKSIDIAKYIEGKLNSLAQERSVDIVFSGGVDVVDVEWRRKKFDVKHTPFSLATQKFEYKNEQIDFRYALYIMAFENDREDIEDIIDELYAFLSNEDLVINDWNIRPRPINVEYGGSFSEGSGMGVQRFEVLLLFEGFADKFYGFNDILFKIDDEEIPLLSVKFNHGKLSYINKDSELTSANSHNFNTNALVIQTPLSSSNTTVMNLIGSNQKTNIVKNITFNIGSTSIVNDDFEFEGFTFATNINDTITSVFLYFSMALDKGMIKINGEEIPITDFSISVKSDLLPHSSPLSNVSKSLWLGSAKAFAFNIAEDNTYQVLSALHEFLAGESEVPPIYEVEIKLGDVEMTKSLVVDEITKESRETINGALRVIFLESGE